MRDRGNDEFAFLRSPAKRILPAPSPGVNDLIPTGVFEERFCAEK